jgi:hypothetical protein
MNEERLQEVYAEAKRLSRRTDDAKPMEREQWWVLIGVTAAAACIILVLLVRSVLG